jgi:hypothetical protein
VSYLQTETVARFLTLFQAEFDSPKTLLQRTDGFLKSLVDDGGDKDAQWQTVEWLVNRPPSWVQSTTKTGRFQNRVIHPPFHLGKLEKISIFHCPV